MRGNCLVYRWLGRYGVVASGAGYSILFSLGLHSRFGCYFLGEGVGDKDYFVRGGSFQFRYRYSHSYGALALSAARVIEVAVHGVSQWFCRLGGFSTSDVLLEFLGLFRVRREFTRGVAGIRFQVGEWNQILGCRLGILAIVSRFFSLWFHSVYATMRGLAL